MFISNTILLKSGDGGNGCISYNIINNKYYADGGDGGKGGGVYLHFKNDYKIPNCNFFISDNGKNGVNKNKNGKNGIDNIIKFPVGIKIEINNKKKYIIENNFFLKILNGGIGGKGNSNFKKFFFSKIAKNGKKGKMVFLKFQYIYFLNKCFININFNFFKLNNFFFKKNFISKIYIFYINILYFKIFLKIIKFFLYFLYIKNFNKNVFWIIIDGIENIQYFYKIKKIKYVISTFFLISSIFYVGIKKFFHFIKLWKNS